MQRIKTVTPTRLRNAAPAGSTAVLIHPDVIGLILLSASSQSANGEDFCEESKDLLLRAKLVCRAWRKTARLRLMEVSGGFLRRMNAMRESAEARDVAGIIGGMQFFLGHAGVQSTCCEALLALTGHGEWHLIPQDEDEDEELADVMIYNVFEYMVDRGVIAALREAVRAHTDAEAVLRPALKMLNLLASSEDEDIADAVMACIADQGGIDAVLAGLKAHPTSAQVQELGLEAIVTFGGGADWAHTFALYNEAPYDNWNVRKIVEEGGIETVVTGLRAHQGNVNLQKIGLRALKVLSSKSDKNHVVKKGGLDAVLVGLHTHRHSSELQGLGISLLANFAFSKDNETSVMVIEKGAIDSVISGMEAHRENIEVQRVGLLAMAAISSECVNARGERIIDDEAVLEDKQVIETLLAVSEAHRDDGHLQALFLDMQLHIIFNRDKCTTTVRQKIQAAFIRKGGVHVVLETLLAHTGNAEVLKKGWFVLALLSICYSTSVAAEGGIETVLTGLSAHWGDADMQRKGLMLLDCLTSDHDSAERLVKNLGIEAVVAGLEANQGSAEVQKLGIDLLGSIIVNGDIDKNRELIVERGGVETVLKGMRRHCGHTDLQEAGMETLFKMAFNHTALKSVAEAQKNVDAWSVATCYAFLREFTLNTPVSVSDQKVRTRIVRAGGEDCVCAAMLSPGLSDSALVRGKTLLDTLDRLKKTTFATFEAGLRQCSLLKKLMESIRELVNEADFKVSSTGISLQAMDPNHASLVSLNLQAEGFEHFHCDRSLSLGINLEAITKVLGCAGNDDSVTLNAEDQGHHLTLMFASPNMDRITDFEVKLIDIDSERLSITNTDYKASVKMSAVEFKRIVCDLSRIGDTVTISCTKAGVKFSIEGNIGNGIILKRHHADVDQEEDMTTIQLEEPVSFTVALRYLNLFTKATPLSPTVTLNMSPYMPLAIEYKIAGMGHIRFFVAPVIEET